MIVGRPYFRHENFILSQSETLYLDTEDCVSVFGVSRNRSQTRKRQRLPLWISERVLLFRSHPLIKPTLRFLVKLAPRSLYFHIPPEVRWGGTGH